MQIKITFRDLFTPVRKAKITKINLAHADEDVGKRNSYSLLVRVQKH